MMSGKAAVALMQSKKYYKRQREREDELHALKMEEQNLLIKIAEENYNAAVLARKTAEENNNIVKIHRQSAEETFAFNRAKRGIAELELSLFRDNNSNMS